jgi:hypothetical protein
VGNGVGNKVWPIGPMVQGGGPTPCFLQTPPAHGRRRMEGIPMPDPQLILIVLLLAAAVMYGYFYFKRAQARSADAPVSSPAASTSPAPREPTDNA